MFTGTLILLAAASSAYAHGFVPKYTIAGKDYVGPDLINYGAGYIGATMKNNVIHQTWNGFPLKGASNGDLACNSHSQLAPVSASAMPGDEIQAWWTGDDGKKAWPHDKGPILTYLASCGSQDCSKVSGKDLKWFKIDQSGLDSNNNWASKTIYDQKPYVFNLPKTLAPGNYMLRSEVITLSFANYMLDYSDESGNTGAEFYPSCANLKVGGSQTGAPSDSELVSFPGAYKDTDPGIYVKNMYSGSLTSKNYVFPGPAIAAFVSGKASANPSSASSSATHAASTTSKKTTPTSTKTKSTPTSSSSTKSTATNIAKSTPSSTGKKCKRRNTTRELTPVNARSVKRHVRTKRSIVL